MPPRAAPILTVNGNPITRNPARVVFAAELLRANNYAITRDAICSRWGVHKATAERDIRAAKQLIALETDFVEVRAGETKRNERIADKAEALADRAAAKGEHAAAATLHKAAIAASREVSKLNGAYAPKQIEVHHSTGGDLPYQLDAILAILDDDGIAAMRVVIGQIEAAKSSGRLALPEESPASTEDIVDAEIVEETRSE
jgi:hypothetical protein